MATLEEIRKRFGSPPVEPEPKPVIIPHTIDGQAMPEPKPFRGTSVFLDQNAASSGTSFPYGTRRHPVNNEADAIAICKALGIDYESEPSIEQEVQDVRSLEPRAGEVWRHRSNRPRQIVIVDTISHFMRGDATIIVRDARTGNREQHTLEYFKNNFEPRWRKVT